MFLMTGKSYAHKVMSNHNSTNANPIAEHNKNFSNGSIVSRFFFPLFFSLGTLTIFLFLTKNLRLSNKQQEKKNTPEMNRLENDVVNAILLSYFHFGDRVVLFSCISKYWQQFIIKSLAYESLRPYALASWMAVLPNIMMCKTLMAYLNDEI